MISCGLPNPVADPGRFGDHVGPLDRPKALQLDRKPLGSILCVGKGRAEHGPERGFRPTLGLQRFAQGAMQESLGHSIGLGAELVRPGSNSIDRVFLS